MRWAGNVACMGEETKVYKVLVGKPEGKRPLGRLRCRMDLRETGWGGGVQNGFSWLRNRDWSGLF
jgi:hypothetical protein